MTQTRAAPIIVLARDRMSPGYLMARRGRARMNSARAAPSERINPLAAGVVDQQAALAGKIHGALCLLALAPAPAGFDFGGGVLPALMRGLASFT